MKTIIQFAKISVGDYMKFKNVLLASDFDGTLKNDEGIITPDVIEKIKYFISEGGYFTVCTGRIFQGFHLCDPEYINAPVLLGNGAMAYDYEKNKVLFEHAIGDEGIAPFEAVLKSFPEVAIEFYNFNNVYSINLNEQSERHFTSQNIEFKNITSVTDAKRPWTKAMILGKDKSLEIQELLKSFPEINFLGNDGDYIEVIEKHTDKGVGILTLGEMLGCDKKDIYAAGDGYNDVEMLVAASAGFVPENGSKEALAVAKYVTRSNNDGCVAHAIEILDELY